MREGGRKTERGRGEEREKDREIEKEREWERESKKREREMLIHSLLKIFTCFCSPRAYVRC